MDCLLIARSDVYIKLIKEEPDLHPISSFQLLFNFFAVVSQYTRKFSGPDLAAVS